MSSIDDKVGKSKFQEVKEAILGGLLFLSVVTLAYRGCFATRTVKDVVVVKEENFCYMDGFGTIHCKDSIIIDKSPHCLQFSERNPKYNFSVGERLKEISWRPYLFGNCEHLKGYEK